MIFERMKLYKMENERFKYVVNASLYDESELKNFSKFLNAYNKNYSNENITGKIIKRKITDDITRLTYEIDLNKRAVLNAVFFNIMKKHLKFDNPEQEGYKEEYDRVKGLITSTCDKVAKFKGSYFSDFDVEELEEALTRDEKVVYCELFQCIDTQMSNFYINTFETASYYAKPKH